MAEPTICIAQQQTEPIKIIKWKVSVGNAVSVGRIILLYETGTGDNPKQRKLKSPQAGTVHKIAAQEGAIVKPGELLCEFRQCTHPTIMNDMCAECGTDLRKDDTIATASVPMVHSIPDLKVSEELAQKLGKADNERLLRDRKLVLLVDLDQTLIHTTNDNIPPNIKDVYHFQLYGPNSPWYHTRLRPSTHQFLENISLLFELHICTFGARNYAHMIAAFLDGDQKFFSNRILSRDECFDPTSKKANLKALFPCGDDMVCIIDDREDVWSNAMNLIHVKPYHFFQHTGDINAPPGLDKHENDDKEGVDLTKIKDSSKSDNVTNNNLNRVEDAVDGDETVEDEVTPVKEKNSNSSDAENKLEDEVTSIKEKDSESSDAENKLKEETVPEKESVKLTQVNGDDSKDHKDQSDKHKSENKPEKMDETSDAKVETANSTEEQKEIKDSGESETNEIVGDTKLEKKDEEELIEIEDPDCYLLYLEDILKRIHESFYEAYDRMESGEFPDLKKVIPMVRGCVLKGCKLVFSGLVPTHIKLEQSKAYQIARNLGADVTQDLDENTTHLVAVRPGTAKVNAGRRKKNLKMVTPDWLWCCAERWEHVDEKIFPLNSKGSKNRHPPPHCSSPEHIPSYPEHNTPAMRKRTPSGRFMDTINPLMSFSSDDIADMDKEVEDILDDESDSSEDEPPPQITIADLEKNEESSSSNGDEFIDGEFPRGSKRKREDNDNLANDINNSTEEDEMPSVKFRRGESVDDELDVETDEDDTEGSVEAPDEGDDGEWNIMGAALEREFLSNN